MSEPKVEVRKETAEERLMAEWFQKQVFASPDNLEAAARLLIGLITGLLGTLLGVLSLSKGPRPDFLNCQTTQWIAIGGVAALLISLWSALWVVLPQRTSNYPGRPDLQGEAFAALVQRKSCWLKVAVAAFAVALTILSIVLAKALFG